MQGSRTSLPQSESSPWLGAPLLNGPRSKPLVLQWRTRLCLLQGYALLSMLLTVIVSISSMRADGKEEAHDGTQVILMLIDKLAISCHAIALFALFGLTEEIVGPLGGRVRSCLASCLFGNADARITAFPRVASGFF